MRTTITLDPDARMLIERAMRDRDLSFKDAVNQAIRAGLAPATSAEGFTEPRSLGPARIDLTHALAVAGAMEDDAAARDLTVGR